MIKILGNLLLTLILIIVTSCDIKNGDNSNKTITEAKSDSPPAPCEERSTPLDIINKVDTLKILIESSDCGEWGGHRENIYLQRNTENKIFARFIMDKIPCDKIIEKGGMGLLDDKARVIVIDTIKFLNSEDEKLISIFLQRLLELYLKNEIHANSGSVYQVINTDSTLKFTYWNSGECRDTYYKKVREQLFGEILKMKNK